MAYVPIKRKYCTDKRCGDSNRHILCHIRNRERLVVRSLGGTDCEMKDTLFIVLSCQCAGNPHLQTFDPGASIPNKALELFNGRDDEVTKKPKGKAPVRTTFSSGIVAFELTVSIKVSGLPDTVLCKRVDGNRERGRRNRQGVRRFFINVAFEPDVP